MERMNSRTWEAQFGGRLGCGADAQAEGERAQGGGGGQSVHRVRVEVLGEFRAGQVDVSDGAVVVACGHVLAVIGQGVANGVMRRGDGEGVDGLLARAEGGEGAAGGRDQVCGLHEEMPFRRDMAWRPGGALCAWSGPDATNGGRVRC